MSTIFFCEIALFRVDSDLIFLSRFDYIYFVLAGVDNTSRDHQGCVKHLRHVRKWITFFFFGSWLCSVLHSLLLYFFFRMLNKCIKNLASNLRSREMMSWKNYLNIFEESSRHVIFEMIFHFFSSLRWMIKKKFLS